MSRASESCQSAEILEDKAYRKMVRAARGKKAKKSKVIDWVFDHIDIPPNKIKSSSVPSQGAPRFLRTAKSDPKAFYEKFFKPSKTDVEEESRRRDDGRELKGLIDLIIKAKQKAEAEARKKGLANAA